MAVCVPLILGTLIKPAEQPIIAPPGKTGFGMDCKICQSKKSTVKFNYIEPTIYCSST
jgi:hypothetical protein